MQATPPRPATAGLDRTQSSAIAAAFLPAGRWGSRYDYYYARTKLRTDPLYPGVVQALQGDPWPLLDLGCGLGLLAHALRAHGHAAAYAGLDIDAAKIARADRAATLAGLPRVRFAAGDATALAQPHHGSVALLDVLHYLSAPSQQDLLSQVTAMLAPGARLVIRTPLADGRPRARFTRLADRWAHRVGWMRTVPRHYPSRAQLQAWLEARGLRAEFAPLYGRTPFNNWLVVAQRG